MRPEELEMRVRDGYEAFNRGDYDGVVAMMRDDVELHSVGPQGVIRGRDAVLAFMHPDALEDQRIEVLDTDVRGAAVIAHYIVRAVGAGSGVPVSQEGWQVWWTDADGLGYRSRLFTEREAAEQAVAESPPEG
jgi:ketosteroid isomerase-like protein